MFQPQSMPMQQAPVGPPPFPTGAPSAPPSFPGQVSMPPTGSWVPQTNGQSPRPMLAQGPRQPRIRMQMEETPPAPPPPVRQPVALTMPSPEALGIAASAPQGQADESGLDWNLTEQRLRRLGVVGFNRAKVSDGYRVTLLMPTGEPDRSHCVEAAAANEATAVRLALQRAEEWAALRR